MTRILEVIGAIAAIYIALTESDRRIRLVALLIGLVLVAAALGAFPR
jgi:hypothetical protein